MLGHKRRKVALPRNNSQHLRSVPLVITFVCESIHLALIEIGQTLEAIRISSNECGFGEQIGVLAHAFLFGEEACISRSLLRSNTLSHMSCQRMPKLCYGRLDKAYLQGILDEIDSH